MNNKKKIGSERVYIDNDLTWKERRVNEKVMEKHRELRRNGQGAKMIHNKVINVKEIWTWSERTWGKWFRKQKSTREE